MSRYFDALKRLRRGREDASIHDVRLAEPVASNAPEEPAAGPSLAFPELQLASRQASYAALLDLLRAASKTSSIPAVVIAGVSRTESAREVVTGIDLQAHRKGISLRSAHLDLSAGARVLHLSARHPLRGSPAHGKREDGQSLRLSGSQEPDALSRWLQRAAADCDLLLIEAPPMSASVEAALLGGACMGLVLVAEALITKQAALQESMERARLAGCEILGLVITGTRRWLPGWMGRLSDMFNR